MLMRVTTPPHQSPPTIPKADPNGLFRPAPTDNKRSTRYFFAVFGITAVLCLVPFLLDQALPEDDRGAEPEDLLLTRIATSQSWPLTFDSLESCAGDPGIDTIGYVDVDCAFGHVTVVGMVDVPADPAAVATAFNRGLRVTTGDNRIDVDPTDHTAEVLGQNPDLTGRSGAQQVWLSAPYTMSSTLGPTWGLGGNDGAIHYAVGFFRDAGDSELTGGELVVVDVEASDQQMAADQVGQLIATAREVSDGDRDAV